MRENYRFQAIGVIHTQYKRTSGVPIQGIFRPKSQGVVDVFPEYEAGLADIDGFSHLILLYVFHQSRGFDLKVKPYMEDAEHGLFAMRAPKRPNPIGLSVVRLVRVEGRSLYIAEADMLDGSPLLDIKPYVPQFDSRENVRVGWMGPHFEKGDHRRISDDRF
jgi:tRNA-Thr(GGU) m(6)t(6)A37 methyltransferase TsaA